MARPACRRATPISGVDLVGVARACGIARAFDVQDQAGLETLAGEFATLSETLFARVRIAADEPQRVLPSKDGVELKLRFRGRVAAAVETLRQAGNPWAAAFRLSGQPETEPL